MRRAARAWSGLRFDRVTAVRILRIHEAIQRECYPNARRLAEEFEVHPRTIQRDIAALKDFLGAPVKYDPCRRGYYYAEKYRLPQVRLTEGEVATFYLGCHLLAHFRGTPFEQDIESALNKLALMLPNHVSAHLSELGRFLSFDTGPAWGDTDAVAGNLKTVSRAIEAGRKLRITYYTPGRDAQTVRTIAPYHLRFGAGRGPQDDGGVWRMGGRSEPVQALKSVRQRVSWGFDRMGTPRPAGACDPAVAGLLRGDRSLENTPYFRLAPRPYPGGAVEA